MTAGSLIAYSQAVVLYPVNNGFEVTNQVAANVALRATYVSGTNTVTAPGWTLYSYSRLQHAWSVLERPSSLAGNANNITNGNSGGTASTYGQALFLDGGDGKYGANATLRSSYASTEFTLSKGYSNVTVQFNYRMRAASFANTIQAYIVSGSGAVWNMGSKAAATNDFVTFVTPGANAASLAAGTYKLYLVGAVDNKTYNALVDNVQINAEPASNLRLIVIH